MLTTATVRDHGHIDEATATRIAELWNATYPTMRAVATARISAYRTQVAEKAWEVDPNHPHADDLRAFLPTEAKTRRRLKNAETLRRELGQLDRGTHRACTFSPGGFSVFSAYAAVRRLLAATSLNDHGLAAVYGLAAALADASDELMAARTQPAA
ncbi:hypothetical protein [Streptomyces odontomachi]|uniref:hypothetical protein n=1 Tax=Streptomyces odontomachi TaxID=2944940 RepID=UPI00210EE31B|nr:hypothetical protein [Streptomyces sp. ODS25]